MSSQGNEIEIDLKSDISEGERARKKLAEIESQVKDLKSSFESGNVTLGRYNQELRNLESQANRARSALDKIQPEKLSGQRRASAKFQTGLAAANIIQDVAAAGPAAGINNLLGLAGNNSARALGAEWLAAAGGIGAVSAALAGVAVAAGAAYLVIDNGLKEAKLGWSDLDDVIANTGVWKAFSETANGGFIQIKSAVDQSSEAIGVATNVTKELLDPLGIIRDTIGFVSDGWDEATAGARKHKEEIEAGVKAAQEYAASIKALSGVKSDEQKETEARGKTALGEITNLGGKGGLDEVINKLADRETARTAKDENGNDRMVTVPKLNDKGEPTGENEEITRREQARRRIQTDVYRASQGDRNALERLKPQLANAGYDASKVTGRDVAQDERVKESEEDVHEGLKDQEAKDKKAHDDQTERMREAEEDAADQIRDLNKEDAAKREKGGRKAMQGTGLDKRVDDAMIRAALASLASGGTQEAATAQIAGRISRELQGKGIDAETADKLGREKAEEHAAKLGDETVGRAMEPAEMRKVEHSGSADFTRSVESSGFDQKILDVNTAMKDQLAELVRLTKQGPVLGP